MKEFHLHNAFTKKYNNNNKHIQNQYIHRLKTKKLKQEKLASEYFKR